MRTNALFRPLAASWREGWTRNVPQKHGLGLDAESQSVTACRYLKRVGAAGPLQSSRVATKQFRVLHRSSTGLPGHAGWKGSDCRHADTRGLSQISMREAAQHSPVPCLPSCFKSREKLYLPVHYMSHQGESSNPARSRIVWMSPTSAAQTGS